MQETSSQPKPDNSLFDDARIAGSHDNGAHEAMAFQPKIHVITTCPLFDNVIELNEDDSRAIEAMIQFKYGHDYDMSGESSDGPPKTETFWALIVASLYGPRTLAGSRAVDRG